MKVMGLFLILLLIRPGVLSAQNGFDDDSTRDLIDAPGAVAPDPHTPYFGVP
jgi:hypothetical protein